MDSSGPPSQSEADDRLACQIDLVANGLQQDLELGERQHTRWLLPVPQVADDGIAIHERDLDTPVVPSAGDLQPYRAGQVHYPTSLPGTILVVRST